MSIRQALRARFRSGDRDEGSPSKDYRIFKSTDDTFTELLSPETDEESSTEHRKKDQSFDDDNVYQLQLQQLQEQLVAAMIENQNLQGELLASQQNDVVRTMEQNLKIEKSRVRELSKELERKEKKLQELGKQKKNDSAGPSSPSGSPKAGTVRSVDEALEATEDMSSSVTQASEKKSTGWFPWRLQQWALHTFYELLEDFTETADTDGQSKKEEDPLAVKKLKDNIGRFKTGGAPVVQLVKTVHSVLTWHNPALTACTFLIYMYAVWCGCLLPVIFFLLILRLIMNLLISKGFPLNISIFKASTETTTDKEAESSKELGMSDKFNLVLLVAREVQNTLGKISDALEKIKNLLTWQHPRAALQLLIALCAGFVASCLLPTSTLLTLTGLYLGVKLFVIDCIYRSFPRIRHKHDTVYRTWLELPTDSELKKQQKTASLSKHILSESGSSPTRVAGEATVNGQELCEEDINMMQLFSLPRDERPLQDWAGGRRCTFINKDKPLMSSFKHGKLFLTRSFFCFTLNKPSSSVKDMIIPLSDITRIKKAKPFSWMPGGGMSIELTVVDTEKPHLFGALLNRDEAFNSLMSHAIKMGLPWAAGTDGGCADDSGSSGDTNDGSGTPALRMSELLSQDEDMTNFMDQTNDILC